MSLLVVLGVVVLASFAAVVVVLETARRRPLTPTDLYCAALDERLADAGPETMPRMARTPRADAAERDARAGRHPAGRGTRSPGIAV